MVDGYGEMRKIPSVRIPAILQKLFYRIIGVMQKVVKYLRPFKIDTAKHWISHSLKKFSIQKLQGELVRQGFKILYWQ